MRKFNVGDKVQINSTGINTEWWFKEFLRQYPKGQKVFEIDRATNFGTYTLKGDKHLFTFTDNWLEKEETVTEKPKVHNAVEILEYANELMENCELDDKERLNRLFGYIEATAREE